MSNLVNHVLTLRGVPAYALVGALVFAEAAVFLGFVVPGETAVLLGGVLAANGSVSLPLMLVVTVLAAIGGDSAGYEVGRKFGTRVLTTRLLARRQSALAAAQQTMQRRGGPAVLLARFSAFLRAVTPGLAGTMGMPYRRFLGWNALGGLVWATGFTFLGYAAGASYQRVARVAGQVGALVVTVVLVVVVATALVRRRLRRQGRATAPPQGGDDRGQSGAPGQQPAVQRRDH